MAVLLSSRLAVAQELPPRFYSVEPERGMPMQAGALAPQPGVGWPIAGGVLAGTAGFFAGAVIAGNIAEGGIFGEEGCGVEDLGCLINGILAGAAIGESILLPVGIHLGNGRRGNLPLGLVTSLGLAGLGVAGAAGVDDPWPLVPAAVAQLVVGVLLERRTRAR
jgi:hypothetical protein